jgi:hypothetical protein
MYIFYLTISPTRAEGTCLCEVMLVVRREMQGMMAHGWAEYIVSDYMKILWLARRMDT